MELPPWARKHQAVIHSVLGHVATSFFAFFVGLIVQKQELRDALADSNFSKFYDHFHWWWLLIPLMGVLALIAQTFVARTKRLSASARSKIIETLLQMSVRALLHPDPVSKGNVRAFFHLAYRKEQILVPECAWSHHTFFSDKSVRIPYTGENNPFVIARAFTTRDVVAQDLQPGETHHPTDKKIEPNLRCVLAAPLRDFDHEESEPLGTVSFDSEEDLATMKFDSREAKNIAMLLATCIFHLMKE